MALNNLNIKENIALTYLYILPGDQIFSFQFDSQLCEFL